MLIDINRAVRWKCNFNHEKRGLICFYFSSRLLFSVEGFGRWEIDNPLIDKKQTLSGVAHLEVIIDSLHD